MITEQDIEAAALELEAAEAALGEFGPARRWLPSSREVGAARAAARGRVEQAAERLEFLARQREAEQADIADRPRREKAAGKRLGEIAREQAATRKRFAAAAEAAQDALAELLEAAGAVDAVTRAHAGELLAAGLRLEDGSGVDHKTGATLGRNPLVQVRGQRFLAMPEPVVAVYAVLARVADARLPRHNATRAGLHIGAHRRFIRRADEPFRDVPDVPEAADRAELPALERAASWSAPTYVNDRRSAQRSAFVDQDGRPV